MTAQQLDPVGDVLKGRTLVNLTADSPPRARETADWAAERGVDCLDGSIMTPTTTIGGPATLVLYSGPEEVYETHQPTLASLGGTATYLSGGTPDAGGSGWVELFKIFKDGLIELRSEVKAVLDVIENFPSGTGMPS